jgi:tetratricopeptide (TPR) repeat protein
MLLRLLQAREAVEVGAALADDVLVQAGRNGRADAKANVSALQRVELQRFLDKFLTSVDRRARPLRLNIFKRAKLANTFKWKLLERGFGPDIVGELTRALLLRLSAKSAHAVNGAQASLPVAATPAPQRKPRARETAALLAMANDLVARGEHAAAVQTLTEVVAAHPRHAVAHNQLGTALCKVGRYQEAEEHFRRAVGVKAGYVDALCNLGIVLRLRGLAAESEIPLRRVLKLKPSHVEARSNLGAALMFLGRPQEARGCFEKVLRLAPRHVGALIGLGEVAGALGRFDEAERALKRALDIEPAAVGAWEGLVRLRKMTSADRAWLVGAEKAAFGRLAPLEESTLRFAIAKYYDDIGDCPGAFRSYQRANELRKTAADPYDRAAHKAFVDDLIRVYSRDAVAHGHAGASDSERPVFVVGMPRSGTTLIAQIIHAHPAAFAAGELGFWAHAVSTNEGTLRRELPDMPLSKKVASAYLATLAGRSAEALRVVDKATTNSDYLGIIHSIFPRARMIYVRRDPVDTCLSCYFQPFSPAVNFAMDLTDLAHYYREHRRLATHWRNVLPPGTLLEVPYAELVADAQRWTRRIIEFLGLPWDERCLNFHEADRVVLTSSFWQVRQKLYTTSVGRWRNYEEFIGPLLELRNVE